ncbi:MAG TPA: cell division protein FtsH, partial [Sutterella sp.]|nr:cell division protein FtsH [Sutterella sp.]
MLQKIGVWVVIAVVCFTMLHGFESQEAATSSVTSYTQFMEDAKTGKIARVDVKGREITVTPRAGEK